MSITAKSSQHGELGVFKEDGSLDPLVMGEM